MERAAVLQPKIHPVPALRRPWFKNKIVCDEGWSVAFSGSSWRVDRYDYYEEGKHLILGGEGAIITQASTPQDIAIRVSQRRAPTRARIKLLKKEVTGRTITYIFMAHIRSSCLSPAFLTASTLE